MNRNRRILYTPLSWITFAIFATFACAALTACSNRQGRATTKAIKPELRVITIAPRDFSADIASFGSVVYTKKNDVTAAVEGTVDAIPVREGDAVGKGLRIATLKNVQLWIRRDQAAAALKSAVSATALAEAEYEDARRGVESRFIALDRTALELGVSGRKLDTLNASVRDNERLLEIGGITEDAMRSARDELANAEDSYAMLKKEDAIARIGLRDSDLADSGYQVPPDPEQRRALLVDLNTRTKRAELEVARSNEATAETELSSAEALVRELSIESPIEGIVGALYKEPGERVEAGEKIMTVFSSEDAWVVFPVNEGEIARVKKGMPVSVTVESLQREPIAGTVDIVSPTVDPQSGNVTVKALVRRMASRAKPGMFANVTVATGKPVKKTLIPLSALSLREGAKGAVITVRGGRAFTRAVELGMEYKGEIEVTGGLAPGERVALEPSPVIKEGDEVLPYEK